MNIKDRVKHAWNAFSKGDTDQAYHYGVASSRPPHRNRTTFNVGSFVSTIYNRIAIDVSMAKLRHVKVDTTNEDEESVPSHLNNCLSVEANIDQTHIQFIHDLVYSMFDEGVVAVVPVETTLSPEKTGSFDIKSLRVGKIINWFPRHVEVDLYNDKTGQNERLFLEKSYVAIVENPLYSVINDSNSTLKRLIRKLQQLDAVDAFGSSNRLDLIIAVPYSIKTQRQRETAEDRILDIETQLASGNNGIAYIDGTEKIQQLNRPIHSQLPESIEKLTQEFYNQLGLTQNVFNGTAKEEELRTYYSRAIDPIIDNIVAEFTRKFITKTSRTQGHKVTYYRDMFKMIPIEVISTLGDTLRRNYIATSNEIRKVIGFKPSDDPRADELFNPNIADNKQDTNPDPKGHLPDSYIEKKRKERRKMKREEQKMEEALQIEKREKAGSLTPPDNKSK